MTHRFPIKELARQSGLSTATVDRVLNNRAHVSAQTRNRVLAAISELEQQEQQLSAKGRQLFVDVVVEAPHRFSREVQRATEAVLPRLGMAVFRPRFVFHEVMSEPDVVAILDRIGRGRSQGVCLKARDLPPIRAAVERLRSKGIPVVTLVTDMPGAARLAYTGLDNARAGGTAAYLLAKALPAGAGQILATRSQDSFFGEAERLARFKAVLGDMRPDMTVLDLSGAAGLAGPVSRQIDAALPRMRALRGVYSMGGGNAAILSDLARHGWRDLPFVAHDLDHDNRHLLRDGKLTFVLHHDLEHDMGNALRAIGGFHGLAPVQPEQMNSSVQIITPYSAGV
ncbi:MAG: substrate-binding domain-containing protein [Paracoccaceae bacterium]